MQTAQHVIDAGFENIHGLGEPTLKLLHQVGGLGFGALLVPLHEHALHRLAYLALAPFRNLRQDVAVEVHLATLPLRFQNLASGALQPAMRVGNDELNTAQPALFPAFEELRPALLGFGRNHIEAEHLAPAMRVHTRGDYHRHALYPIVLPHFLVKCVHPTQRLSPKRRSRNCRTFSSNGVQSWLTWPAETPAMPNSPSTASIFRVLTPCTTASWMTLINAARFASGAR